MILTVIIHTVLNQSLPCLQHAEHLDLLLQFQLTVNFVALVIAFVSALTKGETPLTVIQLLWVNLIMDALGALGMLTTLLLL